jgi:hypothetical protein
VEKKMTEQQLLRSLQAVEARDMVEGRIEAGVRGMFQRLESVERENAKLREALFAATATAAAADGAAEGGDGGDGGDGGNAVCDT